MLNVVFSRLQASEALLGEGAEHGGVLRRDAAEGQGAASRPSQHAAALCQVEGLGEHGPGARR
jgi:hypothetical protein